MDRLTAFLYLLGRDELPLGTIEKIMLELSKIPSEGVKFSNQYLEQYARDVAERLTNNELDVRMKRNG